MTVAEVADRPATSIARDLLGATPIVALRAAAAAFAVAALGQVPPSLVNAAGGGLAVHTQLRVGWLYTMAGHAVSISATGSGTSVEGLGPGVLRVRLGLLTIAGLAVVMLAYGARAAARKVDDLGIRRVVVGAMIAVPYGLLIGGVNAAAELRLDTGGGFLPAATTVAAPVWEGFALPAAIALVAGIVGGWSASVSWQRPAARAVRAGGRAFLWAGGLSLVGLLAFASLRPDGLERYSVEVWSDGPHRAALYLGHQALLVPNQAMWVLAPSMGGCVSLRADGAARDLICLDRLPSGPDPATWLLSELGRVGGRSPTAPMPVTAWLFVVVPAAAIVLAFRGLGRAGATIVGAIGRGALGGLVFAVLVSVISLASSLWLSVGADAATRLVALGPDPVTTAVLASAWGVVGGAAVSAARPVRRRLSRRVRPR
jgi:hypothetical protein